MYTFNVLLCLMVVATVSGQSFKERLADHLDKEKMAERTKLIDVFSFRGLYLMPQSLKSHLKEYTVKDLHDFKNGIHEALKTHDVKSALEHLKENAPKIHDYIAQHLQQVQEQFEEKKKELNPEAQKVFDNLHNLVSTTIQKAGKIVASIKPKTKENIIQTFPHLESLLNSPLA